MADRASSKELKKNRLDGALYVLFSRHARGEDVREDVHDDADTDARARFHAAALAGTFTRYRCRSYGVAWVTGIAAAFTVPLIVSTTVPVLAASLVVGALARWLVLRAADGWLRVAVRLRRRRIDQTVPAVTRYLRLAALGTENRTSLCEQVSEEPAYGETTRAFRRVCARMRWGESTDDALRAVARETPAQATLAPLLLTLCDRDGPPLDVRLDRAARRQSRKTPLTRSVRGVTGPAFGVVLALGGIAVGRVGISITGIAVAVGSALIIWRRHRWRAARNDRFRRFIHSVADAVQDGRTFEESVTTVARERETDSLQSAIDSLAAGLSYTTVPGTQSPQTAALDRFATAADTPLAREATRLLAGSLAAGGTAERAVETLRIEISESPNGVRHDTTHTRVKKRQRS